MPSTMTHSYFAIDVYKKLSKAEKNRISNLEDLKLFSQGSDPYMFYHFLIGKKAKYYGNLQYYLHSRKTQEYFINLINYIVNNNLSNNKQVIAFLYGTICHYFLDLNIHPFILYMGGKFKRHDKSTYKYNAKHQEIEYDIDRYLIMKRENISVNKFKIHKEIFGNVNLNKELLECINVVVFDTYGFKDMGDKYRVSVKYMKWFFYLANYDRFGIKYNIYKIIDKITPQSVINVKELSYYNKNINLEYLNEDNARWKDPYIKDKYYNYSFFDLYEKSLNEAVKAIKTVNKYIYGNNRDITILKNIFTNLSYVTGYDCDLELEAKYFKY